GAGNHLSQAKFNSLLYGGQTVFSSDKPVHVKGVGLDQVLAQDGPTLQPVQARGATPEASYMTFGALSPLHSSTMSYVNASALQSSLSKSLTLTLPSQPAAAVNALKRQLKEEDDNVVALQQTNSLVQQESSSSSEMVSMVGRNQILTEIALKKSRLAPVQSKKELEHGYLCSEGIPYVSNASGELVVSTSPTKLYVRVLLDLANEKADLLGDNKVLVNYVTRHAFVFERHWIKFVKDLKRGQVDDKLALLLSEKDNARLRLHLLPNPARSKQLDDALRQLGFHDRASGMYGGTKPEAQDNILAKIDASRKHPHGSMGSGQRGAVLRRASLVEMNRPHTR
ncbi:unnamed protein product, partial [Chrysoparadoxa australica]